jgi:hypothetical protein
MFLSILDHLKNIHGPRFISNYGKGRGLGIRDIHGSRESISGTPGDYSEGEVGHGLLVVLPGEEAVEDFVEKAVPGDRDDSVVDVEGEGGGDLAGVARVLGFGGLQGTN